MIEKKIGRYMSLRMGLTISLIMSFIGSLMGNLRGGHFAVPAWLLSFVASYVLSAAIALLIGFLVPMKKVNDAVTAKFNLTPKTLKQSLVQSVVSNCIYTPIIGLAMAFFMTGLFAMPAQQRGKEAEIAGKEQALAGIEQEIADTQALLQEAEDPATTGELNGKLEGLNAAAGELRGEIQGIKNSPNPPFVGMALGSFAASFLIEFVIAVIVVMIVEPKFMEAALKKYVPNYGVDIDAEI